MTDMDLAEEIERGHVLVIASAPFQSVSLGAKDQIIAALRRERPLSGEMVMVPRDTLRRIQNECRDVISFQVAIHNLLSAAEAEVRKPCPLCGRTDPHSHTSSPLGMS